MPGGDESFSSDEPAPADRPFARLAEPSDDEEEEGEGQGGEDEKRKRMEDDGGDKMFGAGEDMMRSIARQSLMAEDGEQLDVRGEAEEAQVM